MIDAAGPSWVMTALVAILGGLIPTILYVLFVWWLDRYEKEPASTLILAFSWGALPAALASLVLEMILLLPISMVWGSEGLASNLIGSALSAPLVEETCKGLAIVGLVLLFPREFDDVLDGIVYGAMIGFGFALTENLFAYYLPLTSQMGLQVSASNLLLRSIGFGANHAFWSAILGASVGSARLAQKRAHRIGVPMGGWLLAVSFHAIHNVGAILTRQIGFLSLGMSLIVDWGGILLLLMVAARVLRREQQWIRRGLVEEVRGGLVSQADLNLLLSAGRRFARRWAALRRGGRPASRALGRFFQSATDLAFAKQHLRSLGDEGGNLAQVQRLREELGALRKQAAPWL
jgi:RsiW-degrading membrane proteinase PrsW (M82 family)